MKKYTKKYNEDVEDKKLEKYYLVLAIVCLVMFVSVAITTCKFEESNAEFERKWRDADMQYPASIQYDRYSNFIE